MVKKIRSEFQNMSKEEDSAASRQKRLNISIRVHTYCTQGKVQTVFGLKMGPNDSRLDVQGGREEEGSAEGAGGSEKVEDAGNQGE